MAEADTSLIDQAINFDPESLEPEEAMAPIDLTEEASAIADMAEYNDEPDDDSTEIEDHDANLADGMEESYLSMVAQELLQLYEEDRRSRSPWDTRFEKGMALMGIVPDPKRNKPFPTASEVTHPVLAEAGVQFNSRAIVELFPPGGPVKTRVIGGSTPGVEDQRARVEAHMNYQYVEEMEEAFDEMDKLTFRVAFEGSSFKKTFYDRLLGRMRSIYVSGRDIVLPFFAQGLLQSPRVSHYYKITHNDALRRMKGKDWRSVDLDEPQASTITDDESDKAIAESESREPTSMTEGEHEIVEMQVYYDLKGYEDVETEFDDDGVEITKETGIGLPYTITIEKQQEKILAIRRNWDSADDKRTRELNLTHYGFIPGFGFYNLGFIHLLGGLAEGATGAVRALLDSAQFAAAQGGFKSKEGRMAKGSVTLQPGVYKDIDLTADELSKAFYTPPYKEPPLVLFNLLGALTDYARRFSSTTEAMVGDQSNNGPVGTTLAIIEQGMKVFSAIHKRMHAAQMREFRILARLNARHLPETPMPISWGGGTLEVQRSDYDGRVDVLPVSDPNLFSQTQRIALAQAVNQLADQDASGAMFDKREAKMLMLRAMGLPKEQIDVIMPDPMRNIVPLDVVTENQMILMGKPIKAYPWQFHAGHIKAHDAFVSALPPEIQQAVMPAYIAHKAEHLAHEYRVQADMAMQQMSQGQMQIPLQEPNFSATGGEAIVQPVSPEMDRMIAMAVAQTMGEAAPQQEQQDPAMAEAMRKADRDDMLAQRAADREDKLAAREVARKDTKFQQELEIKDGTAAHAILSKAKEQEGGDA